MQWYLIRCFAAAGMRQHTWCLCRTWWRRHMKPKPKWWCPQTCWPVPCSHLLESGVQTSSLAQPRGLGCPWAMEVPMLPSWLVPTRTRGLCLAVSLVNPVPAVPEQLTHNPRAHTSYITAVLLRQATCVRAGVQSSMPPQMCYTA